LPEYDNRNTSVYLPETNITADTCQSVYHHNYLQSVLANQQIKNEQLALQLEELLLQGNRNSNAQGEKIQHLEELLFVQEGLSKDILEEAKRNQDDIKTILQTTQQTERLAADTEQKLIEEQLVHTAILDQFTIQETALHTLTKTLETFKQSSDSLTAKISANEETQQKIEEKLDLQEVFQQTILEKMEDTDAKVGKLTRQMDQLKGIVFERIQFLATKLEDNMKSLVMPVHQFFVKANDKENK